MINDLPFVLIDPNSPALLDDLKECSHLIFRHTQGDTDVKIYDAVFNIATRVFGIDCYPNFETWWPYEDKIKEYFLLKSHGFPIIDSRVFWNYEPALQYLNESAFPIIAKLPKGAASTNVVMLNSAEEGKKLIRQVFFRGVKNRRLKSPSNLSSIRKKGLYRYSKTMVRSLLLDAGVIRDHTDYPEWQVQKDAILFQKYLPGNTNDTRVNVIGNRAIAFRRFVRKNDFRASGSGNFDLDNTKVDIRCVEIAMAISKKLGFKTMAYDFIYDENKNPKINEISYCFVDWIVQSCPGYWDDNLVWHEGRNWPQYYQLCDFLKMSKLKSVELQKLNT
jgi:glutathione synthase/RimK-type ligase-like ATP-grasp enzyme